MLTAAVVFLSLAAQEPQAPRPSELISRMLAHYSQSKTLTGTIKLRQGANGQFAQGSMDTTIQFEWPSKLYIRQVQNTSNWGTVTVLDNSGRPREVARTSPPTWLVTSDGVMFAYDVSDDTPGNRQRLLERVQPRPNETLDVRGIYTAAARSLGDRSAPLEIAIGRKDDLRFFTQHLVTLEYAGKSKIGEEEVHVIRGDWRDSAISQTVVGSYEIFITDKNDFKRYVIYQSVRPDPASPIMNVVSQWDINLVVNGKPDPALFKVVK